MRLSAVRSHVAHTKRRGPTSRTPLRLSSHHLQTVNPPAVAAWIRVRRSIPPPPRARPDKTSATLAVAPFPLAGHLRSLASRHPSCHFVLIVVERGHAFAAGSQVTARCASGKRRALKTRRECPYTRELTWRLQSTGGPTSRCRATWLAHVSRLSRRRRVVVMSDWPTVSKLRAVTTTSARRAFSSRENPRVIRPQDDGWPEQHAYTPGGQWTDRNRKRRQ